MGHGKDVTLFRHQPQETFSSSPTQLLIANYTKHSWGGHLARPIFYTYGRNKILYKYVGARQCLALRMIICRQHNFESI
ncbi:hypothetical protein NIES2107_18590 [Nostoc carneum NIES-2107]|nr:hypothetical protein NIES2107_18590 [Nostoc carneum NIES-2107]